MQDVAPEAAEAVSGWVIHSTAAALVLDAVVVLALLALKVFLFDRILVLVTHNAAHRSWRRVTLLMLAMGGLYAVLNPNGQLGDTLKSIATVSLVCALLTRKLCWIDIDKAILSSSLFCALAVGLDLGVGLGLDHLFYQRKTINRSLAALVDARVRIAAHDDTLPPSRGLTAALQRYSTVSDSEDNSIVGAILAPVRAGAKAQAQIKAVNEIATEQAKLVNMLSGAGTNLTKRSDELKALHEGLTAVPEAAPGPDIMKQPPAAEPPPAPAPPAIPPAPPAPPAPPTNAAEIAVAPAPPPATPVPAVAVIGQPPAAASTTKPASAGSDRWNAARSSIKVTGVGHSAGSSYVLVGDRLVRLGEEYQVVFSGRSYTFRLAGIDWKDRCEWEPVIDQPSTNAAPTLKF